MALTQEELDAVAADVIAEFNDLEVTPVASPVETLLTATTQAGMRIAIDLGNVKDYGAVGNGSTNDRPALVLAEAAAVANGGAIRLTSGTYLVSTSLTLTRQVIFEAGAKLKPASGQTITLSNGFIANDRQHIFDVSAGGSFSVQNRTFTPEMFGAVGDGTTNDAPAFTAMVNSIYRTGRVELNYSKSYRINSTIVIDGSEKTIRWDGTTGARAIIAGGIDLVTAPTIIWGGSAGTDGNNQVMFSLTDGHGSSFERIAFQTMTSAVASIDIDYVTAIRFTNTVSTRFASITRCEFRRLRGIHFYDLGDIPENDYNMDGHRISECQFYTYRDAIKIEQSNVYDTTIDHCAFYGDAVYTKHHLHIAKGHVYSSACYWGKMKDAASVGGKNGTGVLVQNGCIRLDKVYSETDNGPFLDWDSSDISTNVLSIDGGMGIMQDTGTLPSTWSIRNKTSCMMAISDIHVTGTIRKEGTTGSIAVSGMSSPRFEGELSRCTYSGDFIGDLEGLIGSAAGKATLSGTTLTLQRRLQPSGYEVKDITSFDGTNILVDFTDAPGVRLGVRLNAMNGQIDFTRGAWKFIKTIPEYANNAAAISGGLTAGMEYHTAGVQKIVT